MRSIGTSIPRFAMALAAVVWLAAAGRDAHPALLPGDPEVVAPFVCEGIGGEVYSLDALLEDRPFLVLAFWGLQCAPCIKEIERLNDLSRRSPFRDRVRMIAVNTDGIPGETLAREMEERGIAVDFSVVADRSQSLTNRFVNGMIPLTVLIGEDRRVRFSILGASRGDLDFLERTVIGGETEAMER